MKSLVINGNVTGGSGESSGQVTGTLGTVLIQGSLIGGAGTSSGDILSQTFADGQVLPGPMTSLVIRGSVLGGTAGTSEFGGTAPTSSTAAVSAIPAVGGDTGVISAATAKTVMIGGSVIAGTPGTATNTNGTLSQAATSSGIVDVSVVGNMTIVGSIIGGAGLDSGQVIAAVAVGNLSIGGDVVGGTAGQAAFAGTPAVGSNDGLPATASVPGESGFVNVGNATTIKIAGSLIGGTPGSTVDSNGTSTATADTTGVLEVGNATTISIGKSLIGGGGPNTGAIIAQSGGSSIGTLSIAQAITGGSGTVSGAIEANLVSALTIGQGLTGGSGSQSGVIQGIDVTQSISYRSVTVNGDIVGGSGATSGCIILGPNTNATKGDSWDLQNLQVNGSVIGGSGFRSAEIFAFSNVGPATITGSILGGTGSNSGELVAGGTLAKTVIDGNLTGNTAVDSATAVINSGYIQAATISNLDIKGNVTSGANSGGAIANSGAIRGDSNIVDLTIGGSVIGTQADPVIISAQQALAVSQPTIANVAIGGSASWMDLLAGYSDDTSNGTAPLGAPVDGSAVIDTVTIGGTMSASNIVAGVMPTNGQFGQTTNMAISTKVFPITSEVESVTVAGAATGNSTVGDSFGIEAQSVKTVSVNGLTLPAATVGTAESVNGANLYIVEVS